MHHQNQHVQGVVCMEHVVRNTLNVYWDAPHSSAHSGQRLFHFSLGKKVTMFRFAMKVAELTGVEYLSRQIITWPSEELHSLPCEQGEKCVSMSVGSVQTLLKNVGGNRNLTDNKIFQRANLPVTVINKSHLDTTCWASAFGRPESVGDLQGALRAQRGAELDAVPARSLPWHHGMPGKLFHCSLPWLPSLFHYSTFIFLS